MSAPIIKYFGGVKYCNCVHVCFQIISIKSRSIMWSYNNANILHNANIVY